MKSVLGTILDPAADKALMTTLVITLAWEGMLPRECSVIPPGLPPWFCEVCAMIRWGKADEMMYQVPLAVLILGRDVALSISAFYYRYISLPHPVRSSFSPFPPVFEMRLGRLTVFGWAFFRKHSSVIGISRFPQLKFDLLQSPR
jgi:phosphatidylglycerophosphate synthase